MIRTHEPVFLGQRLYHFRADPQRLDGRFLLYALLGPDLQSQIRSFGSGSTVEHMRLEDIELLEICAPDLAAQRDIAELLGAYDDLIENNLRRIRILEDMARAIYREWFVHFRFPGHEGVAMVESELGPIPQNWGVRRLGHVVELLYGKALKESDRRPGQIAVFGSSGVIGSHSEALVPGPGIVVGRKGNVGSVHWSAGDYWPIDTVFYVRSALPLRFLYWDLRHKKFLNSDAAVPGLNREQAYSLPTICPPSDLGKL